MTFSKETLCSPAAVECYKTVTISAGKCAPCQGLYADISIDTSDQRDVEQIKKFSKLIESYEIYKSGSSGDITYPKAISGIYEIFSLNFIHSFIQTSRKRQSFT